MARFPSKVQDKIALEMLCEPAIPYVTHGNFVENIESCLWSFIDFVFKNTWLVLLKAVHTTGEIFRCLRVEVLRGCAKNPWLHSKVRWCSYNGAKHCWKHSLREQARETGKLILDRCNIAIQLENPGHTGTACLVVKQIRIGCLTGQLTVALCKFRDGYIYFGNNRGV
ncbi:hypothetical protein BJX62DRAFT_188910 [Aspergillus germanicus]